MKSFTEFLQEESTTYKPPSGAAKSAQKALDWKAKYGDEVKAMTKTGWHRANQLAKREELSYDTVKRMHSFFSRHKGNEEIADEKKDTPWKDNGYVSYLGWGGAAGRDWAKSIVNSQNQED